MTAIFGGGNLSYERAFRALGKVAERKGLRNVCLLELDGGVVLQGQVVANTREGYILTLQTSLFNREELENLIQELGF